MNRMDSRCHGPTRGPPATTAPREATKLDSNRFDTIGGRRHHQRTTGSQTTTQPGARVLVATECNAYLCGGTRRRHHYGSDAIRHRLHPVRVRHTLTDTPLAPSCSG